MSEQIVVVNTDNVCEGGAGTEYRIEFQIWGGGCPQIVMLHDGLGSVAQWRDTPAAIADRCGVAVLAYNRPGHGRSEPVPSGPWPTLWLHHQANLLRLLLEAWEIERPLLVGHSDGGSIALLHAADSAVAPDSPTVGRSSESFRGVVALAAHSFVEPICAEAITRLREAPDRMHKALAPFHAEPEAVFAAWSGVWLSEPFSHWDIRAALASVDVPTWIVQGDLDEYGTEAQLWTTNDAIGSNSRALLLPGVGHLIHHEDPASVVDVVETAFQST